MPRLAVLPIRVEKAGFVCLLAFSLSAQLIMRILWGVNLIAETTTTILSSNLSIVAGYHNSTFFVKDSLLKKALWYHGGVPNNQMIIVWYIDIQWPQNQFLILKLQLWNFLCFEF